METTEKKKVNLDELKADITKSKEQYDAKASEALAELGIKFDKTVVDMEIAKLRRGAYHSRVPIDAKLQTLLDSLQTYGFGGAIFASLRSHNVIDGWHRCEIWAEMGNTHIPCFLVDCTLEQEMRLHLRLNTQAATFDLSQDFGLTFPGLDLIKDYGFTAADLAPQNPRIIEPQKPKKPQQDSNLASFNTRLFREQYDKLKAIKEEHRLADWAGVIGILLDIYETR